MKFALTLPAALLLTACAGQQVPLWSKDVRTAAQTHHVDAPPAEALAAAAKVVRATADARDVNVKVDGNTETLTRYYVGIIGTAPVTITYTFTLTATPAGKGSDLSLSMKADRSELQDDGFNTAFNPLLDGAEVMVADPYKLFFARMDYVLGARPDWVACAAAPAVLGASMALDPLCFRAYDTPPAR